jgi:predicted methyltransferase
MTRTRQYPEDSSSWANLPVELTDDQLVIGGWQVMQAWETPLMDVMAKEVTAKEGHILEVGFGMGISANHIINYGCDSYTVIEAHPAVAEMARAWAKQQTVLCTVIEGPWQDIVPTISPMAFDGILFDTYPFTESERGQNHFAFIPQVPSLLCAEGIFVCYSDETTAFRSEHLRLLLDAFDEVRLIKVSDLQPGDDCEYWSESHMVVPVGHRPSHH